MLCKDWAIERALYLFDCLTCVLCLDVMLTSPDSMQNNFERAAARPYERATKGYLDCLTLPEIGAGRVYSYKYLEYKSLDSLARHQLMLGVALVMPAWVLQGWVLCVVA